VPLPAHRKQEMRIIIENSTRSLKELDHRFFADSLPKHEYWRAFPDFEGHIAYLDIETTGLFPGMHEITVIGVYDGKDVSTFVNGTNLDAIEHELKKYSVLITFNGARFDLPFIAQHMPQVQLDHLHIDLVYPLRRLGYRGGLKSIERQLKIERDSDVARLTGWDAVRLWNEYKRGSEKSLETLIKYNSEDIVNLKELMQFSYTELKRRVFTGQS
jgi:uncharacterized protein YprB with RNaseH-like and TPR domain